MRFILLTLFTFNLQALDYNFLHYHHNFQNALVQATQEKKLLMLLIVQDRCHWCKKLSVDVLGRPDIAEKIRKDFLPVVINKDRKKLPKKYQTEATPTIYFINPIENEEVWRSVGFTNKVELLELLKKAMQSYKDDLEDDQR